MRRIARTPLAVLAALLMVGGHARASAEPTCTEWILDAPTRAPDGGIQSTQCTCTKWIEGSNPPPLHACDLCVPDGICLKPGATSSGCSHGEGHSVVGLLAAVVWVTRSRMRAQTSADNRGLGLGPALDALKIWAGAPVDRTGKLLPPPGSAVAPDARSRRRRRAR